MRPWSGRPGANLLAAAALLGAAALELGMREHFHQLSAEALRIAGLMGCSVALACLWVSMRFAVPARRLERGQRLVVVGAACVSLYFLAWPDVRSAFGDATLARTVLGQGVGVVCVVSLLLLSGLPQASWSRCRWALVLGCMLFVASQQMVGQFVARPHAWPPVAEARAERPGKSAQIYLLLDELNAGAAAPFVEALREAGLPVNFKSVQPVAHATAQVVPQLFSGQPFAQAKPCGWTTVCSNSAALDFSMISATRPDIDVVGFYMPYCAMRGLRYCARLSPVSAVFDPARWRCGFARRLGLGSDAQCANLQIDRWQGFVSDLEQAIWRAPLWSRGGMMYAHVPLPHPPGSTVGGSLAVHYRENVGRALELVRSMVDRARRSGFDRLTIVIFSDHPLRPWVWCSNPLYSTNGCPPPQDLLDERVPVIVAGDSLPSLDGLKSNGGIFSLLVNPP
jgi:hypothetical protein